VLRLSRLLLLGLLSCPSCGESPRAPGELDLLARSADEVFEHLGTLTPDADQLWGSSRVAGWESELSETEKGHLYVRANQRICSLLLPAGAPEDRTLLLRIWAADKPDQGGKARVRLNGIDLGAIQLRRLPNQLELAAPRAAWVWGQNLLEIESETLPAREKTWRPIALASVSYGAERLVRKSRDKSVLAPQTGLRYLVEPLRRSVLDLAGRATGPGSLEVLFHRVDPGSGLGEPLDGGQRIEWDEAGPLERSLLLPDSRAGLLQIDLRWVSRNEADFELERARLSGATVPVLPPIILLSVDTLAARHLSLYGYERPTTPSLERLARDAVVFESCVANAPWTLPSYLSLMSGLYPRSHAIEPDDEGAAPAGRLETWDTWQLAANRWTLAEMLRGAGYATAAFVDTPWISSQYRLDQGFEVFDLSARMIPKEEPGGGIQLVTELATSWIDENEGVPFFAFLHALDAHGPYAPQPPWKGRFTAELEPETRRMVRAGGTVFSYGSLHAALLALQYPDGNIPAEVDITPTIAAYDEEILALDEWIGRFLAGLKERGLYDEALILVTADHGESFDHDYYGHSGTLHESILKVPLIVKLPGNERGGTRIAETVQLTDVYPTLVEFVLDTERPYLHGRSLLGLIRGDADGSAPAFSEDGLIEQYALEHDGWKLIELVPGNRSIPDSLLTHPRAPAGWIAEHFPRVAEQPYTSELRSELEAREDFEERIEELREMLREPIYELYDLSSDPCEEKNLADERPDVLANLRHLLELEKARREEARKKARPSAVRIEMSEEDLETLRKLGYVDDGR
jgi:arylsulfatase A-like enzyme